MSASASACALPRAPLSSALPDCRAYEQVSPVFKGGSDTVAVATADSGDAVIYRAHSAFTGSSGGTIDVLYRASRTSTGWQTASVAPPATSHSNFNFFDISADLGKYFAASSDPDYFFSVPSAFQLDGYIGSVGGSAVSVTPPGRASIGTEDSFHLVLSDGASEDLSHLLFKGNPGLVPGDQTNKQFSVANALVEDVGAGSGSPRYRLVGVTGPTDATGSGDVISQCGTVLGIGDLGSGLDNRLVPASTSFHAISSDGATVFFTAATCDSGSIFALPIVKKPSVNELFARVGGNGAVQSTVPVSEPAVDSCQTVFAPPAPLVSTGPADCADATFQGAAADGSHVYFTTTQADEVPGNTDATNNLYMAKVGVLPGTNEPGVVQKVQVSAGDTSPGHIGAQVQGVVRVSDDGSHVYFVARGVLASGASQDENNLYVAGPDPSNPAVEKVSFIADLCSGVGVSGNNVRDTQCVSPTVDDALFGDDNHRPAQATPDGRFLVFDSAGELTPDDTDTATDVYIYDSLTGSLRRASAGHNGADGDGNDSNFPATISSPQFDSGSYASLNQRGGQGGGLGGRAISDDGAFVFFTTSEALQQNDLNSAPDVYEWHAGHVALISDGQNPDSALPGIGDATTQFVGTSSSGRDVFFQTTTVLDPAGGDGAYSIYDARIDGGFPASTPAQTGCSEDACQGPLSATPFTSSPGGSATTQAGDNLKTTLGQPTPKKPKPKPKKRKKPVHKKARKASRGKHTAKNGHQQ